MITGKRPPRLADDPDMTRCSALALVLVLAPTPAGADGWITGEAPAAVAVSDAQQGVFQPGVMPAVGVYAGNHRLALGLRLRAGVLRDGPAPDDNRADPGFGGLTTAGLAVRVQARGGWFELVGGGGVTGHDLVPSFELGVGWAFAAGDLALGPAVRYVRVISHDDMDALGSAELALVGIDVTFGRRAAPRPARIVATPEAEPPPPPPPAPAAPPAPTPVVSDGDAIVDREPSCAAELDGCRLTEELVVNDDRIVLEDRVLFDTDRARVKSRGRRIVKDLVRIWKDHPEWTRITIEGHADVRGDDDYNQWLSQLRADRVRAYMIKIGVDPARLDAIGYGRSRPRVPGVSEYAMMRNRRVEFVIERGGAR